MRRRLSTRTRLSLLAMVAVAPALVVADAVLLLALAGTESAEVRNDLAAQASLLQAGIDDSNGHVSFGPTGGGTGSNVAAVIVSGGRIVASVGSDPLAPATATAIAAAASGATAPLLTDGIGSRGDPQRVYAAPLVGGDQGTSGVLVVSRSVAALQTSQTQALIIAVLLSVLTLVLTGLVARWLAGRVLRPVRTIASLARGISEKDLHRRVAVGVPADELGELVATFNAMLGRLERDFHSLRRFTADASHELRAPLAIMRGELELSLARARSAGDYQQSQRRLLREVEHLSRVADRLLLLARADAGTLQPERAPVDVDDLLTELVERWRAPAARRRVTLTGDSGDAGTIAADAALLRQVLDNLVDNALRHAPAGSAVTVRATSDAGGVGIDVADHGPGVPAELRPLLFDRFFRGSPARTPGGRPGAAGLGLAVSWSIARAHGGDLSYIDGEGGAVFRLWIPQAGVE
ncbi:MAG: sensor histidine kinase [Candidatus Dormibacteria bacterium]